ncbi:Endopolyphosphatase [Podila clonocystis]|nr:Endopolyphosphatase [Podila clonocystis]
MFAVSMSTKVHWREHEQHISNPDILQHRFLTVACGKPKPGSKSEVGHLEPEIGVEGGTPLDTVAEPDLANLPRGCGADQRQVFDGRFLHLTDIHPDEFYLQGSTVASSCHSLPNITSSPVDVPQSKSEGGYYGTPDSICDSPFSLVNATFAWIDKHLAPEVDFVVWTGDNARHDSDNTHPRTQDEINALNQRIAAKFLDSFGSDSTPSGRRVPVVPSIGNNDVYPHNIMPAGPNPMLQTFANLWSEFIPAHQINTFRRGGYYSSEVVPGKIAVIALNTLYFYIHNAAVNGCVRGEDEPGTEEMDWLEAELGRLRDRGLLVYLTGHVPPEVKSYTLSCHKRYIRISLAYQDIIVGHIYGHANIDHFFLLSDRKTRTTSLGVEGRRGAKQHHFKVAIESIMDYNDEEDEDKKQGEINYETMLDDGQHHVATTVGLTTYLEALWDQYSSIRKKSDPSRYVIVQVSPSMIPTYNPSLRVFSYQLGNVTYPEAFLKKKPRKKPHHYPPAAAPTQFGYPLAYTQYWCNLARANKEKGKDKGKAIEYEIEYRSEDYGLAHLGTAEWLTLAQRIEADQKLKSLYLERMVVQTANLQ